ncbi:hypothetical protein [Actibacterium sp. XHP0104]|uniref:hypothetical protein n=1 Tax=Actibacterium sp. XHP0104 TaxID=2984335 RepID=UPI0021E75F1B|nr:hypothetical protein [Actibacterium sp. XHP0104]MCV2881883.1 hypothetical protein [Actibacterium sp. XHP0104]
MIYPNEFQPRRPDRDEDGELLSYRTYISRPDAQYDVFDLANAICQTKLYRWVKTEFVNGTPIAELHAYLFWDQPLVSKRHLGATILQAVAYDPRKLKAKTKDNPRACMYYCFRNSKDLEYGLEWMISMWIRRVVYGESQQEVQEALDELADCEEHNLKGLFWQPMLDLADMSAFPTFNWRDLWAEYQLEPQTPRAEASKRPELRSFE